MGIRKNRHPFKKSLPVLVLVIVLATLAVSIRITSLTHKKTTTRVVAKTLGYVFLLLRLRTIRTRQHVQQPIQNHHFPPL